MGKCEINNKTELNLYCNLLSVAYELYKDKTNGMVCGSEAENIRDKMYKAIKEAGIIDTKWRFYLGNESEVIIMFGICLLIFIGLCIYHACEKELPADYHNNWRLEAHDSQLVREGKMTQRQSEKNINNGKYR